MYGHDLEPSLEHALRDDPPRHVLDWLCAATGTVRVLGIAALPGGMSSALHRVTLATAAGTSLHVVLRRYVLDWVVDEAHVPPNEVAVLTMLDGSAVPAPRLVAADPDGSATGTPAVVMSLVPGRVVWEPADREPWLRGLAESLAEVHSVPAMGGLGDWFPYAPEPGLVPPPWTRDSRAWDRAGEAYAGAVPSAERVFLHRDYHPGNLLWTDREVTGLVDWPGACIGPPEADVAHCRFNLAVHAGDPQAADRFLALWLSMTGRTAYDPYWDLQTVVSVVSEDPDPALDAFVAGQRALRRKAVSRRASKARSGSTRRASSSGRAPRPTT